MNSAELCEWMNENPGWRTSREMWYRLCENTVTFHRFRRRVQWLLETGRIMRRVKHENFSGAEKPNKAAHKWSYKGPVYEYRRVVHTGS